MADRRISFIISANMQNWAKNLNKAQKQMDRFAKNVTRIGTTLSTRVTAPLLALGTVSVRAWDKQAKAIAQVEAGLRSTGGAVGYTSQQLQKMASDLQKNTLFGDEEILQGATAQLLTFTNITGQQFARTQQAALDLATRLDGDLKSASIQLGKALNDPVANLSALSRSGIQFSKDQKAVIKALAESGRLAEAQSIILDELNKQYGGSAAAAAEAETGFTQLKNTLGDLAEEFGRIISQYIKPFVKRLQEIVTNLKELDNESKARILKIAATIALLPPAILAVGVALKGVAVAMSGLAVVFSPIGLAIATFVGLLAVFVVSWQTVIENILEFRKVFTQVWDGLTLVAANFFNTIVKQLGRFFTTLNSLPFVNGTFDETVQKLSNLSAGFEQTAREAKNSMIATEVSLKGPSDAIDRIKSAWENASAAGKVYLSEMIKKLPTLNYLLNGNQYKNLPSIGRAQLNSSTNNGIDVSGMTTQGGDLSATTAELARVAKQTNNVGQALSYANGLANTFANSFGQGMANIVVQGERLADVLENIGKLLLSSAIQTGITALLTGGLGGTGFFGTGGGLFGEIFGTATSGSIAPSSSIERVNIQGAFEKALDNKLRQLGPEQIYAIANVGGFEQ